MMLVFYTVPDVSLSTDAANTSCQGMMQLALSPTALLLSSTQIFFSVFSQCVDVCIWAKEEFLEGKTVECRLSL